METLELLEELVANYQGTVLLVSHDREFIDNTATMVWAFEGKGQVNKVVGGYQDYSDYLDRISKTALDVSKNKAQKKKTQNDLAKDKGNILAAGKKKLSYKEGRELESLPKQIEELEDELESLQAEVNSPAFFKQNSEETANALNHLASMESKLEVAYARWEELEEKQQNS